MKAILLVAAIALGGCGVQGLQSVTTAKVYIGAGIPANSAAAALFMWNDSVGTGFVVTDDPRISDVTIASVTDDCGASPYGGTFVGYDDTGTTEAAICMGYFKNNDQGALLVAVIAHEIGHVMGLGHTEGPALMFHTVAATSVITSIDIAQFRKHWH